jgi:hypothetical protein
MILVDANLLLYACDSSASQHQAARRWLEDAFSGAEPVMLPWDSILAFLRIATNPIAWKHPLSVQQAAAIVDEWLSLPNVTVPTPGERHWPILRGLLPEAQCRGPLVMDAHLAALAIEHGAVMCTHDRDFARFPGLHLLDPLE